MQKNMHLTAVAEVRGSAQYPELHGVVKFFQLPQGVLVQTEVKGLPCPRVACPVDVFAMHIHENGACTGDGAAPFADAGTHYNPGHCPHPAHAGDLPPLFSNCGYAWSAVYTERFNAREVIGRSVIIHAHPDDFTTQPSGNAGARIGCGVIKAAEVL